MTLLIGKGLRSENPALKGWRRGSTPSLARDGAFGLIKSTPPEMKYENSLIMAEGDMLMLHGRFSGLGLPANWIVVDIVRIENGLLTEHWDVIEDEVTRDKSTSGLPMFGAAFPS